MTSQKSIFLGLFFTVACGLCIFYGYDKYKEYNEPGDALNSIVHKVGVKKDLIERDIPQETKYAGFGAVFCGIAAAYFFGSAGRSR